MANIYPIKVQRDQRPEPPFEVNWASPQALGLLHWWPYADGRGQYDVITRVRATVAGGTPRLIGDGPMRSMEDMGASGYYDAGFGLTGYGAVTVAAWCRFPNITAAFGIAGVRPTAGSSNAWMFVEFRGDTANDPIVTRVGNGVDRTSAATGISAGQLVHIAVTHTGADMFIYLDGRELSTFAEAVTYSGTAARNLFLGARNNNGTVFANNGTITSDIRIYQRALTPGEIWHLYDPRTRWDLYRVPERRAYVYLTGGGPPATNRRRRVLLAS